MGPAPPVHVRGENRLLELLPASDRARIADTLERVSGSLGEMIFRRHEPIPYVDFPLTGVVSIVTTMEDGSTIETGIVGNEGVAGLPLILGSERSATQAFYQVPGEAMRMSARGFVEELARGGAFRDILQRYALAFLTQVGQSAACNRVHPIEQRLARWILMSHDRVGSERLLLTQEIVSQMLGVRRASVTVAAGILQKAGFIRSSRGVITVLDRAGLEGSTCECYGVVRREYERLLA